MVSSVQFQLTSELNAPTLTFTLTCISTGGPATTVSWTVNNSAVTEDSAHITSQVLTDSENATYNNTLMVAGRLVGDYQCTVSNNKPSSSSGILSVVGKNYFQHEPRLPKQLDWENHLACVLFWWREFSGHPPTAFYRTCINGWCMVKECSSWSTG